MNPNFSEELQVMYRNILLQQHNIAYASMIAAFSSAAENPSIGMSPSTPNAVSFTLDSDIPRDEIECDAEIILVKNLRESLKKLETNLNGLHGKKFGFREVIEMASSRSAYPASPNTSMGKRNRTTSFGSIGSPMEMMPATPLTPTSDTKQNETKKIRIDSTGAHDESNASSHDGSLHIDLNETTDEEMNKMQTVRVKKEQPKEETDQAAAVDEDDLMLGNEPTVEIKELDADEYKPSQIRIERMRSIQKKKPKFNIDSLDLTYHSNMARNFPGSENRSEDQQVRRNKNTLAARISRTKNKAYEKMLDTGSVDATSANIELKRKVACLRVYASSLMKMSGFPDPNFSKMWETNIKDIVGSTD